MTATHQKFYDAIAPLNPGRDFVVLIGGPEGNPSVALLQLDGGPAIKTGEISFSLGGIPCTTYVNTGGY